MWRRILYRIQDFFSVSAKEARGIAGLLVLSTMFLTFPPFLKSFLLYQSPEEAASDRLFIDSLLRSLSHAPRSSKSSPIDVFKPPHPEPRLQEFDPNTADEQQLVHVGIPPHLARRIINYRNKGGVFRSKEDVQRIYDFPSELFDKLQPYIRIPTAKSDSIIHRKSRSSSATEQLRNRQPVTWAIVVPFDINTADTTQLKKLRGIGSARAKTIINYRNALGGFYSNEQYAEIYGLDSLAHAELIRYAKVLSEPQGIPINSISKADFLKHPYARKSRRLSEALIRYRQQHGPFHSADDLKKIVPLTPDYLASITPYLRFD